MAVRKLLMWPDIRLLQKVQPVEKINEKIEKIWADLTDTMEAKSCIGPVSYTHLTLPTKA